MIRHECFLPFSQGWKHPTGKEITEFFQEMNFSNVQVAKIVGLANGNPVCAWKNESCRIPYAGWVLLAEAAGIKIPVEEDLRLFKAKPRPPQHPIRPECFLHFTKGWNRPTGKEIQEIIQRTGLKYIQAAHFVGFLSLQPIYSWRVEKSSIPYASWVLLAEAAGIKIPISFIWKKIINF